MLVRVGFSRGRTWVARAICYATQADISHSFFYVRDGGEEWAYEAVPRGFRRIPWAEFSRDNAIKGLVDMDWPHHLVKRALDAMVGTRYPFLRFVVLGVYLMFRRAARRPGRFLLDGVDCVTSVCRLAKEYAKVDLGGVITPDELQRKIGEKR